MNADGDLFGDACDNCPAVSNNGQEDKGDAGKAKIILKGKDAGLAMPVLPLDTSGGAALIQLHNNDNGMCWEFSFAAPANVIKTTNELFKAKAP